MADILPCLLSTMLTPGICSPNFVERFCTLFPSDEGLTIDLKNFRKPGEKTFTQRSRLFVGNLPPDITEEEMRKLFEKYGKAGEVFIHKDKGFGFIRLVSGRVEALLCRRLVWGPCSSAAVAPA